jgi:hypothetical protein
MQLGLGLNGLINDDYAGKECGAWRKKVAYERAGFHMLYSCHSNQGQRNRRHGVNNPRMS